MPFYLDTNAIRKIGKKLPEVAQNVSIKFSVLGMIEILSRARNGDDDYKRCKAQLRILDGSSEYCNLKMPDALLLEGFTYVTERGSLVDDRPPSLNKIIETLIHSESLDKFKTEESALRLPYSSEYFEEYDNTFGREFIGGFDEQTKIIRDAFDLVKAGAAQTEVPAEIISGNFRDFCKWFLETQDVVNDSVTIWALAKRALRELEKFEIPGEHTVEKIYETYNYRTSAFVGAISRLTMNAHGNGSQPGRNDPLDLAHFLYINDGDVLVTSDAKMILFAGQVGVPVKSPEDLIALIPNS